MPLPSRFLATTYCTIFMFVCKVLNKDEEFSTQLFVIVGGWSIPFRTFLKHEFVIQL